eukprot:4261187-Alexandrium_andersonii.AAC.1
MCIRDSPAPTYPSGPTTEQRPPRPTAGNRCRDRLPTTASHWRPAGKTHGGSRGTGTRGPQSTCRTSPTYFATHSERCARGTAPWQRRRTACGMPHR